MNSTGGHTVRLMSSYESEIENSDDDDSEETVDENEGY
jgi:hypothetical protein